jgi:hypothetical protein
VGASAHLKAKIIKDKGVALMARPLASALCFAAPVFSIVGFLSPAHPSLQADLL